VARVVDNVTLVRWRSQPLAEILERVSSYAKSDSAFLPTKDKETSRWHVQGRAGEFELVLTGPRFWDERAKKGGCGAVDLLIHIDEIDFKEAARKLKSAGV
jgi:hypothetical protein